MTQETLDINTFPVILLLLLDRQLKKWRKRVLVSGGITEHQAMPIKPAIVGIS